MYVVSAPLGADKWRHIALFTLSRGLYPPFCGLNVLQRRFRQFCFFFSFQGAYYTPGSKIIHIELLVFIVLGDKYK